jgi:hypothetical protein
MSYTRRELVEGGFAEIGMGTAAFDIPAEMLDEGRRRLDRMMADWDTRGIDLGYPLPAGSDSDLADDTTIPDKAWEAVIANLALRLAPLVGKQVTPETRATAKHGLNTLYMAAAMPAQIQLNQLPAGAGNKRADFLPAPADLLATGQDGVLEV